MHDNHVNILSSEGTEDSGVEAGRNFAEVDKESIDCKGNATCVVVLHARLHLGLTSMTFINPFKVLNSERYAHAQVTILSLEIASKDYMFEENPVPCFHFASSWESKSKVLKKIDLILEHSQERKKFEEAQAQYSKSLGYSLEC